MSVHDDELRDLLTDAVADVEPAYRLDTIRARTRRKHSRRGWYAAGAAVLAAASVVAVVNLAQDEGKRRDSVPPAAGEPHTAALYFVGETPFGYRLYREFQQVKGGPVADLAAITKAGGPTDPDYTTLWPKGIFESIAVRDGVIEVGLGEWTGPVYDIDPALVHALVQAVVYTAQAATGAELPVQFTEDGRPAAEPFGSSRSTEPIQRDPQNEILALVSISDPVEGALISGDHFIARGRANSFEATVPWEIRTEQGVVKSGFATAASTGDKLYAWRTRVDVSGLNPGHYTFVVMTDDPSNGEGPGPYTDTRTIVVE